MSEAVSARWLAEARAEVLGRIDPESPPRPSHDPRLPQCQATDVHRRRRRQPVESTIARWCEWHRPGRRAAR